MAIFIGCLLMLGLSMGPGPGDAGAAVAFGQHGSQQEEVLAKPRRHHHHHHQRERRRRNEFRPHQPMTGLAGPASTHPGPGQSPAADLEHVAIAFGLAMAVGIAGGARLSSIRR